jgi:hypothetical protein
VRQKRNLYRDWVGETKEDMTLKTCAYVGRYYQNLPLINRIGRCGRDETGSGQVQLAGFNQCENKPSNSTKCGEYLDRRTNSLPGRTLIHAGAHPEFLFRGARRGGTGPQAIYKLSLILKLLLQKSCRKYNCNITLFAVAFIYIRI